MTELAKEDYQEPRCVLCMDNSDVKPVPLPRILEKLDEDYGRNDYASAERHLLYWLEEARIGNDQRGTFSLCNEMMGLYRKLGEKEKAIQRAEQALSLVEVLQNENTISAGTCFVNAATVFDAFGLPERSLPLFQKAQAIYEVSLQDDSKLGSLYNNMALAYVAIQDFSKANEYYLKALDVMGRVENGALEQAITYLNMANAIEDEKGLDQGESEIQKLLDTAEELLKTPSLPRNGYYAFVCEKCAPTFQYYGYFLTAKELKETAGAIYARS